ncbi:uncharacterized protein L201_002084 [Kwoniella dendrophila CBS 6074]|uniref:Uncharacterized protein n=1 Tax=Kwoniella dendrophila CBS 6074 TaxID=1295534 RepID=A0AAX4JQP6_9TREE
MPKFDSRRNQFSKQQQSNGRNLSYQKANSTQDHLHRIGRQKELIECRSLTIKESKQLSLIIQQSFSNFKSNNNGNNDYAKKEIMRISIELAKKFDECGIKWDKYRKVMGMHIRGLWEMSNKVTNGKKGNDNIVDAVALYIQGSFVTTAEEPHPLDPEPIPICMPTKNYVNTSLKNKHNLQAGLLSALPIKLETSTATPSKSFSFGFGFGNSSKLQQGHDPSATFIGSTEKTTNSAISSLNKVENLKEKINNKKIISFDTKTIFNSRVETPPITTIATSAATETFSSLALGQTRPGFELHEGLRVDAKQIERQRKLQKWRERKKRIVLKIKIDNHKSTHYPHSAISTHHHQSGYYSAARSINKKSAKTSNLSSYKYSYGYTSKTAYFTPKSTVFFPESGGITPRTPYTSVNMNDIKKGRRRKNGKTNYKPNLRIEVPHQTGKFQTNLIQPSALISATRLTPRTTKTRIRRPLSGISIQTPMTLTPYLKTANSVQYQRNKYKNNKSKKEKLFDFSLKMNLKLGKKRYIFGN